MPAVTAKTIVNPAPASQLVVQTQPSSAATAGQIFAVQPVVDEEDPFGNLETGDNNTLVTASIKGGGSTLEGTTTALVSGGVATFANLASDKAEALTLNFTTGSLHGATATPIVVSPAAAVQLVIQTQPSATATAGQIFTAQPVIAEEDQYGNLETGDSSTVVTVSPSGFAVLAGSTSATVSGGVATFASLAEDKAGTIGLTFTSGARGAGGLEPGHDRARAGSGSGRDEPAAFDRDRRRGLRVCRHGRGRVWQRRSDLRGPGDGRSREQSRRGFAQWNAFGNGGKRRGQFRGALARHRHKRLHAQGEQPRANTGGDDRASV